MDVPVGNQAAQGPGQQQPAAEAELPGVEGQQEGQAASDEEGWMYGEEEEDQGPQPLLQLAQRQVLAGIEAAARGMKPAFSVGGSLGRMSVVLAVTSMPSGGAEGPAAAPSQPAVAVRFPEGGQAALQALEAVCQPATFGKGSEEVLDDSYRRALAVHEDRLFSQFELAHHGGVLEAVRHLLLPDAALLTAKLHALNVYKEGGFFKPHRDTPRGDPRFVGSLVVCLPVGHRGGGLRVEHSGKSVTYDWGPGAAAGEVQWAAFYSDCLHEVLPVIEGARVTLAWELFAHPAEAAFKLPAQLASLPSGADSLLHKLRQALESSSFMVNGGSLGFPLQHAYPKSLLDGITEQDVPAMLKGEDAAVVHVLSALGVPFSLVRVWKEEEEEVDDEWPPTCEGDASRRSLLVSAVQPGFLPAALGDDDCVQEVPISWLMDTMKARFDTSIMWLGGQDAFPNWIVGAAYRFLGGNYPTWVEEFYCALGVVARIPPFVERHDRTAAELAWAGAAGPAGEHSPGPASPERKRAKQT